MKATVKCLLNFRKEPSFDAAIITELQPGETVTVKENAGEWWKVTYKKKTGYIRAEFVEAEDGGETDEQTGTTE